MSKNVTEECPLCTEPFAIDEANFFPCTCSYQICLFCWHRIKTAEDGRCPACRRLYSEIPVDFRPVPQDDLRRVKRGRRMNQQQHKQRVAEIKKRLQNVKVLQRNLVFVTGLPARLADTLALKQQEYFGKFGKIDKLVVNYRTSSRNRPPLVNVYVTYSHFEEAARAIKSLNDTKIDGRQLKATFGLTKYCYRYLNGDYCSQPNCPYVHEKAEDGASFTEQEIRQGMHLQYLKKLCTE